MKPSVTPIFPRTTGIPRNLPVRNFDSKNHILHASGYDNFNGQLKPQIIEKEITCLEIVKHVETCPICSRLFDTDKTLYVLVIIGLLIFSLLMVKRLVQI